MTTYQEGQHANKWNKTGVIVGIHDQYKVKVDGSGRVTLRNRMFLRHFKPATTDIDQGSSRLGTYAPPPIVQSDSASPRKQDIPMSPVHRVPNLLIDLLILPVSHLCHPLRWTLHNCLQNSLMNCHLLLHDIILLHLKLLQKAKKVKHQATKSLFVSQEGHQGIGELPRDTMLTRAFGNVSINCSH